MKSVIRPRAMISPLTRPTRSPVTTAATTAASRPASNTMPKITAASVIAEAIDRSIPAVATTNVWPIASTIRMADEVSIDVRLPRLRNVGLSAWKTIASTTSAIGAAQVARFAGSSTARQPGVAGASARRSSSRVAATEAVVIC